MWQKPVSMNWVKKCNLVSRIDKLKFWRNENWFVVERNNHQIVGLHFTRLWTEAANEIEYHRLFKLELVDRGVLRGRSVSRCLSGCTTIGVTVVANVTSVTVFGQTRLFFVTGCVTIDRLTVWHLKCWQFVTRFFDFHNNVSDNVEEFFKLKTIFLIKQEACWRISFFFDS